MKKIALLVFVSACVCAASPAMADLQIMQRTVINAPGVRAMLQEIPESQRALLQNMVSPMVMGTPWITTTYMQGTRLRTEMGSTAVIVNTASGNEVTMNLATHTYAIGPYNPFQKSVGDMSCKITPTGITATLLGHSVVRYNVAMNASILPKAVITGEIWSAPDMPTPPTPGYSGGIAAGFESEMAKVKGMPLAYHIDFKNTPAGDISVDSTPLAIGQTNLEASLFAIPSDFHKGTVQTAMGTPSQGFPLGDGMPLDSLGDMTASVAGTAGDAGGGGLPSGMNISPQMLQSLMSALGSSGGSGALGSGGAGGGDIGGLLGGLSNGGGTQGGGGDSAGLLQQLQSELSSLLDGDE